MDKLKEFQMKLNLLEEELVIAKEAKNSARYALPPIGTLGRSDTKEYRDYEEALEKVRLIECRIGDTERQLHEYKVEMKNLSKRLPDISYPTCDDCDCNLPLHRNVMVKGIIYFDPKTQKRKVLCIECSKKYQPRQFIPEKVSKRCGNCKHYTVVEKTFIYHMNNGEGPDKEVTWKEELCLNRPISKYHHSLYKLRGIPDEFRYSRVDKQLNSKSKRCNFELKME